MSFNIINNVDAKPAMYVRVPTPKNFKRKDLEDAYWDEEFRRWNDGFSGITGLHYFALQECFIPDGLGRPIRPWWRDCDSEFWEGWEESKRTRWDNMVIKRREFMLSTVGGGIIPVHTALTSPGSESILTSASTKRLQSLFRKKTEFIYDRLNPYYREEKARKVQSGQLFIAKEDRVTKTFSGLQSSIWSIDTVKDRYGFESFRAAYGFIDELFLHPHAAEVKASAASSFMTGFEKNAPMLMGGTCGMMTGAGAQQGLKIYKTSKESRVLVQFFGGTKGIEQFSVNGHCDERAAEEWILQRREELGKSEDKTEYFKFVTSYPLSIEEVFNLVSDCALPQEYQFILNEAQKNIDVEQVKSLPYSVSTNGVKVTADIIETIKVKEDGTYPGAVNIIKPPVSGHHYIAGTDPIPFGNNLLGEGSEYSMVILDTDTMEFVAHYTERNLDPNIVVNNSILLQKLYYRAKTMLELNRGEVVLKEYIGRGEHDLLAPMPTHLGIVWEERKYPYGFYMGGGQGMQINSRCENLVLKWIVSHGAKCRLGRLIHETRSLSTKANTDLLDAAKACLLYKAELDELNKIQKYMPTTHKVRRLVRDSSGRMISKDFDSTLTN